MSRALSPARLAACALAFTAGALALVAPVQATTPPTPSLTFGEPVAISAADDSIIDVRIIAAGDGSVTALWTERNGGYRRLMAATRLAGASSWSAPQEITGPNVYAMLPELAGGGGADGTVTVVWQQEESRPENIYSATRAAGATSWSAPVRISTDTTSGITPAAIVRADGSAVAVWTMYTPGKSVLYATRDADAGALWSAPKTLETGASGDYFNRPVMTQDAAGTISLLYVRDDSATGGQVLRSATLTAGSSTFSAPLDAVTEPDERFGYLTATSLPGGDLAAAWQRSGGSHSTATVMALRRTGGTWQSPAQVAADAVEGRAPRLVADRVGRLMALWTATDEPEEDSHYRVSAAVAGAGGAWSAPFLPAGDAQASGNGWALNSRGWVIGFWSVATSYPDKAPQYAVANDFSGGFGASTPFGSAISPYSGNPPAYAAGPGGMIVAAWQGLDSAIRVAIAAGGQLPDLEAEPPAAEPAPAPAPTPAVGGPTESALPPAIADPPKPRAPQLRLRGRKVTANVRVTLRRRAKCSGRVTATSRITAGKKTSTHRKGLRLKSVNRDGRRVCVITGAFTLRRAPGAGESLRVAFHGANLRLRARIAVLAG